MHVSRKYTHAIDNNRIQRQVCNGYSNRITDIRIHRPNENV